VSNDFFEAVKRGDRGAVEKMLREDPSLLGARDENGTSALLLAYYHGKAEIANTILLHRPDLNVFEAATVGDAARALPVRDLLLDESGAVRPLVNVFVDGRAERDLDAAVGAASRIRIVAAIAGG